jgi:hypothetical protein
LQTLRQAQGFTAVAGAAIATKNSAKAQAIARAVVNIASRQSRRRELLGGLPFSQTDRHKPKSVLVQEWMSQIFPICTQNS